MIKIAALRFIICSFVVCCISALLREEVTTALTSGLGRSTKLIWRSFDKAYSGVVADQAKRDFLHV